MEKPEFNADNEIVYKAKAESDVSELKETLKLVKKIKKTAKKANHLLDKLATKKEQPYITINDKDYSMINVTDSHGTLIASISSEGIIEAFNAHVDLIKDSSKVRFHSENLQLDDFSNLTSVQKTLIKEAASENRPVMVTGKQGTTGKTTLAKHLRAQGVQAFEPFEFEEITIGDSGQ